MAATDRPPLRGASVDTRVLAVENGVGRERSDRLAGEVTFTIAPSWTCRSSVQPTPQ